jgi:hypothetical protein
MSECRTRIAAACVFWLAGVAPGLAQTAEPAETAHFWALLLPNAAVALLGLGWVVLMARRRS